MFVGERYLAHDLPWVLERLGNPALLAEEPAGDPPWIALPEHGVVTSANTVHHLHHLLRYEQVCPLAAADVVVEWGRGSREPRAAGRPPASPEPHLRADRHAGVLRAAAAPVAVLGEDRVALHTEPGAPVEPGRMNVVPLGLVHDLDVTADLFVSTWALNESTPAAQRSMCSTAGSSAPRACCWP